MWGYKIQPKFSFGEKCVCVGYENEPMWVHTIEATISNIDGHSYRYILVTKEEEKDKSIKDCTNIKSIEEYRLVKVKLNI